MPGAPAARGAHTCPDRGRCSRRSRTHHRWESTPPVWGDPHQGRGTTTTSAGARTGQRHPGTHQEHRHHPGQRPAPPGQGHPQGATPQGQPRPARPSRGSPPPVGTPRAGPETRSRQCHRGAATPTPAGAPSKGSPSPSPEQGPSPPVAGTVTSRRPGTTPVRGNRHTAQAGAPAAQPPRERTPPKGEPQGAPEGCTRRRRAPPPHWS